MINLASAAAAIAPAAPPIADVSAGECVGVQNCKASKMNAMIVKIAATKTGRGQPSRTINAAAKYPKKCSRNQWPVRMRSHAMGRNRVARTTKAMAITPRSRIQARREIEITAETDQLKS